MGDEVEVEQLLKFIRDQVPDWDDEVKTIARYKAFSGQRSDCESLFVFWRDLIITIARRFNLLLLSPSLMKNSWFNRGGLTPLCLDHVLLEMYNNGDLLRLSDFEDPTTGRLSQLLMKIIQFPIAFKSPTSSDILNDRLILLTMLEDRAAYVVKALSEANWTSSCIITMKKFESLFKDHDEAFAVLSYLSRHGKALYLSIKSKEPIMGVKVSLSSASVSSSPSIDSVILQLMWTLEELQQQLAVIDEQYKRFRISALAALRSGDKFLALRNARQLKIAFESREKLTAYSDRVEETVRVISDAQSAKKVYEAIQLGAQVIKENKMGVEEVQLCLQELDEFMVSQETIYNALESKSYAAVEDEDIEEELKKLESQIRDEDVLVTTPITMEDPKEIVRASAAPDDLCAAIADLKLEGEVEDGSIQGSGSGSRKDCATLEAA